MHNSGMYIRFDPNKVVLPPILGGPQPHAQISSPTIKKRQHGLTYEITPTVHFPNFEKALQKASENELNYAAKSLGESSSTGRSAKKLKIYHEPTPKDQVKSFESRMQLMQALRNAFRESQNVNFAGTYRLHEPGVTHQERIKSLTHEIWEVTGYRFTIKDHPRTKHGHKTRLWCSQDEAHKLKPSKVPQRPRTLNDGALMAKARYPCRSGLLISSREGEGEAETSFITVRMHHHVAHEPYYDNTLPPEITQSIWANICRERKANPPPELDNEASESGSEGESSSRRGDTIPNFPLNDDCELQESRVPSPECPDAPSQITAEVYQNRMRRHINNIRDFCDGLEYQLLFNDFRMLDVLEREGAQFLQLVKECLEKEGRLKKDDEMAARLKTFVVQTELDAR